MRLSVIALAIACLAAPGMANPASDTVSSALKICATHFGAAADLRAAYKSAGWRDEGGEGTPLHIFTLLDRRVIASFTRDGQPKAGCTTAAAKLSQQELRQVADQFMAENTAFEPHPAEDLTWIWQGHRPAAWLSLSETKKNFTIFRAYVVAIIETD